MKVDRLISSYLGETAANVRKIFEFARKQPYVLLFDEFDALARSREDTGEHNELRRVVNSLLLFIDHIQPKGFLIAATNLDQALDPAVWRRFDEVVWFGCRRELPEGVDNLTSERHETSTRMSRFVLPQPSPCSNIDARRFETFDASGG